ncbi:uncharacterized protein LOC116023462 [Ipomoea triloba]|uniref:uncharacterized protein LOC116023462 n=1 Tax=Ipomoea triloba TaxID=35885 RepID=UPI00125E47AB|nr:uncharacterized protein LOC116023462 [Ipomoea triloba]
MTFCEHIERLMNKYWWQSKQNGGGGVRWLSWNRMSLSKSEGGIGFKNLHKFNVALLAKQGWRMLDNPESVVSRLYQSRYFNGKNFLEANLGTNPSYCWRSILARQAVLKRGCFCRIGDGLSTKIWHQPWLPDKNDPFIQTPVSDVHEEAVIKALIDPEYDL